MLTYEQAYEAALRLMPNIDACAEYENAYMVKPHMLKSTCFLTWLLPWAALGSQT